MVYKKSEFNLIVILEISLTAWNPFKIRGASKNLFHRLHRFIFQKIQVPTQNSKFSHLQKISLFGWFFIKQSINYFSFLIRAIFTRNKKKKNLPRQDSSRYQLLRKHFIIRNNFFFAYEIDIYWKFCTTHREKKKSLIDFYSRLFFLVLIFNIKWIKK